VTANAESCPGTGATTPFDPPSSWDGTCTTPEAIAGGVQSVSVGPLVVVDAGCLPQLVTATKQPHPQSWAYMLACNGLHGAGCSEGEICEPTQQSQMPAFAWTYCLTLKDTTQPCPDTFPIEHKVGSGWSAQSCAPCTCGAPVGGSCSPSYVTVYADDDCATHVGAVQAEPDKTMCVDVNSPIGSLSATPSSYTPGSCAHSGGEVVGYPPTAAESMIFCCQE
jgi:hypothetical protein